MFMLYAIPNNDIYFATVVQCSLYIYAQRGEPNLINKTTIKYFLVLRLTKRYCAIIIPLNLLLQIRICNHKI